MPVSSGTAKARGVQTGGTTVAVRFGPAEP
jgi:hypothetical protein